MQQGQFDDAEAAFKKAARLDPKLRDAQYNLAQIPFKKKEYAKARDRFETLYKRIPGGDKNQAAELIKFKIYMTLLMEGKESRAHSMMEEFQFTGDTPALYYAQAAWEYKHNNAQKAEDWTSSANKIYSPTLNSAFADVFYDVGWLQRPEGTTAPAVAFDTSNVGASQAEGGPAVEPSPIPDKVVAANKQAGTLALAAAPSSSDNSVDLGTAEATGSQTNLTGSAAETSSPPQQSASQSVSTTGESTSASQPVTVDKAASSTGSSNQNQAEQRPAAQTSPPAQATIAAAPAKASSSTVAGLSNRRLWIVSGLLLAAVVLIALAILPTLRRYKFTVPSANRPQPEAGAAIFKPRTAALKMGGLQGNGVAGGPRQVSLQLKPWEAAVRESTSSSPKAGGAFDRLKGSNSKPSRAPARVKSRDQSAPVADPFFESVGPVLEQAPETIPVAVPEEIEPDGVQPVSSEFAEPFTNTPQSIEEEIGQVAVQETSEFSQQRTEEPLVVVEQPNEFYPSEGEYAWPAGEASSDFAAVPLGNDQPYEATFADREAFAQPEVFVEGEAPVVEATTDSISDFQPAIPAQPVFPQTTIPATMPETTQTPPAPIAKAPAPPVPKPQPQAPVPAGGMQTSVQLTFSFEIAAMQLTPSFKMGVLKVRPVSRLVTMRLPSPQRAQSALNLQVGFEVVKIQPVAGALGTIRVVPSQQQRPAMGGTPSFAVAGLQIVGNSETAPVQLTPSPQGRAFVFITVPFQISTLEFSPTLEIGSVTLSSNSKQVIVQLPGVGPGPAEGAPMFEIANLELNEGGEIVMMQLNLLGGPKRA